MIILQIWGIAARTGLLVLYLSNLKRFNKSESHPYFPFSMAKRLSVFQILLKEGTLMKKALSLVMALLMLLAMVPMASAEEGIATTGVRG